MLKTYECYNHNNQPFILDDSNIYRGKTVIKGYKTYILTADKKLKDAKVIKRYKRYSKKGWSLSESYIMITYYYIYQKKTGKLSVDFTTYRPLFCFMDKVYYLKDTKLLTDKETNILLSYMLEQLATKLNIPINPKEVSFYD